jgi:penicillin-binding protein 1A
MKKAVKILWISFVSLFAIAGLIFGLTAWGVFGKLPSLKDLENPQSFLPSEVYGDDGTQMGKFYEERGNRSYVSYEEISKNVVYALIATEDKRYFTHSGIDMKSLARAVFTLGKQGGGSTITQQLSKGLLEQGSKNKATRVIEKLKEWIVSTRLEKNFTKEEIITLYLNNVSFDDNIYGIKNAAKIYFQKTPDRLNIEEAAVLVGMLKANYTYNPRKNPKAALDRRNTVLDLMVINNDVASLIGANPISEAEGKVLKAKRIDLRYKREAEAVGIAPYFRDVVRVEVRNRLKSLKKVDGREYDIYKDGLKIYTTINPKMQIYAEEAVAEHLSRWQKIFNTNKTYFNRQWEKHKNRLEIYMKESERWKDLKEAGMAEADIIKTFGVRTPMKVFSWNLKREKDTVMTPMDSIKYHRQMLQSAFTVMDPTTGEVKAWVGGINYKTFKMDHVTAYRQVGSVIKPMLYCLAMEETGLDQNSHVENSRQFFPGYGWYPKEVGGGSPTLAVGLAKSQNGVASYLLKRVGIRKFKEFLEKSCGITAKLNAYPSICLGADEIPLIQLIRAYTMFAGKGIVTEPYYIAKIEDKNGNLIKSYVPERKEVVSEISAYKMTQVMEGPVTVGTAKGLKGSVGVKEMGGKTGTTNDNTDMWFMGYTPQLLAGAWVGCDDPFIRYEYGNAFLGGKAAAPIWKNFFVRALNDKTLHLRKDTTFTKPQRMTEEAVLDYMRIINDQTPYDGGDGGTGIFQGGGNTDGSEYNSFEDSVGAEKVGAESDQYAEPEEGKVTPPVVPDTGKKNLPATPGKEQPKAVLPPKEDPAKKKDEKKDDKKKPVEKADDYKR